MSQRAMLTEGEDDAGQGAWDRNYQQLREMEAKGKIKMVAVATHVWPLLRRLFSLRLVLLHSMRAYT